MQVSLVACRVVQPRDSRLSVLVLEEKHEGDDQGILALGLLNLVPFSIDAQCTNSTTPCGQGVPRFVKFSGLLKNPVGALGNGIVAIRFVIYGDATQAIPLWQEVQNIEVDPQGHYEVILGVTGNEGVP